MTSSPPTSGVASRRLPVLVGVVGFAIVAAAAGLALSWSSNDSGGSFVTDPVKFDLPTLEGNGRVRLADFEGKPVVVNFFASWCEPCKKELPEFAAAARQLAGKVAFVGVNSREFTPRSGMNLAASMGLADAGMALARDVGGENRSGLHESYRIGNGMPTTAFYDSGGKLKYVAPGELTRDKLSSRLQEFFGVTL